MTRPVPVNSALYNRVKRETIKKFRVYPSIYANAWLTREYKKRGGRYTTTRSGKRVGKRTSRKTSRKPYRKPSRKVSRKTSRSKSGKRISRKPSRKTSRSKSGKRISRKTSRKTSRSKSGKRISRKPTRKTSRKSSSGLTRWFAEKWVDACQLPRKVTCGRKKSSMKNYPYCRPSIRVNASTPKTIHEIPKKVLKSRCKRKRSNPMKIVR